MRTWIIVIIHTYKRIATKVKLIGDPVDGIEMLALKPE